MFVASVHYELDLENENKKNFKYFLRFRNLGYPTEAVSQDSDMILKMEITNLEKNISDNFKFSLNIGCLKVTRL
jgi:hypothetical protein